MSSGYISTPLNSGRLGSWTDSDGNEIWNRTFGGENADRANFGQLTVDGGYVLVGYSRSVVFPSKKVWLIKTNSDGNEEWSNTYEGDDAFSIQQTSDGGYIIGAQTMYGAGSNDVLLIKTDSSGNEVWNMTFGGVNPDIIWSVQQTNDGGYILAGETKSFGEGWEDAWLIKTDSDGNEEWNKTFGGINRDYARSVQQTNDGGYILAGYLVTSSFGNILNIDAWLIKTDSSGNEVWNMTFGGVNIDVAFYGQQISNNDYILTGYSRSFGVGLSDVWLIKVADSDGDGILDMTKTPYPTSVNETGGDVEFTIVVTNNGPENATIDSLVDTDFDLAENCPDAVGTLLASGESYTCTFTEFISGDASGLDHEDNATVTASDKEGNSDTACDNATVTFVDVLPCIEVVKEASPTTVLETGGNVTYTVTVTSCSDEAQTLDSLDDDVYGDLNGKGTCSVPQHLAPQGQTGDSYTCSFTETVSGEPGTLTDTVTGNSSDNDGNTATDNDDATVKIIDRIGYITPTGTTCEDVFITRTFSELPYLNYKTKKGKINSISPGGFFYYTMMKAPSRNFTNFTIEVAQQDPAPYIGIQNLNQVVLYDNQCIKSKVQHSVETDGTQKIQVDDLTVTPGQVFYIGIKYDPGTLKGITPVPPEKVYYFVTEVDGTPDIGTQANITVQPKSKK